MTTERKKWWRKVATCAVGGSVVAGGLFGLLRATAEPKKALATPAVEETAWTRSSAPPAPPVAEVEREPVRAGVVTPAGGTLPIPVPAGNSTAPTETTPPALIPLPTGIEPVTGPRATDAGLVGTDKSALPAVPALPPVELPKLPATPTPPDAKPLTPVVPTPPLAVPPATGGVPALPPMPGSTAEPPKAPAGVPEVPAIPQPSLIAPSLPPVKAADPAQPTPQVKPDSNLNPTNPGNTLNPTSPVAPAVPIQLPDVAPVVPFPPVPPLGGARETPGTPVDRPKPTEPSFGSSDKFVYPVPTVLDPLVLTPRETAMLNLKHTAAIAVIGGAMLTAERAQSAALVPFPPMVPAVPVRADAETDKLKEDLRKANEKITALEKQVARLTELLTGKKDLDGTPNPSDPGAVEEVKRLKDKIATLEGDLKAMKTQTAQRPAIIAPEAKPRGIVKVVNEYPVEISMVINEKSHRIAPNTKVEVEVPAGEFTYQLLQSGAAATRSVIKDKETVTLRIK